MKPSESVRDYLAALGRKGGSVRTPAKAAAARANAKKPRGKRKKMPTKKQGYGEGKSPVKITIQQFRKWREDRRADFVEPTPPNSRRCKCRLCGVKIPAGAGRGYIELMSDFYRGSIRYLCGNCEAATRTNWAITSSESR
jgi:hypothetical protein